MDSVGAISILSAVFEPRESIYTQWQVQGSQGSNLPLVEQIHLIFLLECTSRLWSMTLTWYSCMCRHPSQLMDFDSPLRFVAGRLPKTSRVDDHHSIRYNYRCIFMIVHVYFIHGRCISICWSAYIIYPMFFIFLLLNIKRKSWSSMRWRSCSTCCRTSATVQVTSSPTGKGLGSLRVPECSKA